MGKKEKNTKNNNNEDEKVSIRLQAQLKKDLDSYCEENNMKRSVFLRDAVSSMLYGVESKMAAPKKDLKAQIQKEKEEIKQIKEYLELLALKEEKIKLMEQVAKKTSDASLNNK